MERTHHPNLKHDDWNDLEFTTNFKDKSAILSVNGVNLPITFSKGPVTFYLGGKSPNLQFRRIRVKELGGDDFQPEPGFTSLFNGKDLTGWRNSNRAPWMARPRRQTAGSPSKMASSLSRKDPPTSNSSQPRASATTLFSNCSAKG